MTDQYDEAAHIQETFAYFGRAAYMANVLESALVHTLLQIEFMTEVRAEFIRTQGENFEAAKYERDFDAYMEKQFSKMMGQLRDRVAQVPDLSAELKERITTANKRRNFLIHNYWREAGELFMSKDGRAKMIKELEGDIATFEKLAEDIQEATKPVRKRLGIREEQLDENVEKRMAEIKSGIALE